MPLRRLTGSLLARLGKKCNKLSTRVYRTPEQQRAAAWFRDRGDQTMRLDYDLNEESIVFDLGGFEGQWASDIAAKYACTIHIFEPVPDFAQRAFAAVLAAIAASLFTKRASPPKPGAAEISFAGDCSSVYKAAGKTCPIEMIAAADFLLQHGISRIDLMKINIEGGEYDLLEHLIATGWVSSIRDIQVQFHDFVPNAAARMKSIQDSLALTHSLTYQYPFVWENWRRNPPS